MLDIEKLKSTLIAGLPSILYDWIPNGKVDGSEFKALNPTRADGKVGSFSVNITTGMWADFATGDKGDLISLYAYLNSLDNKEAIKQLSENYNLDSKSIKKRSKNKEEWHSVMPIPGGIKPPPFKHFKYGEPSLVWIYHNQDGKPIGYICRYDLKDGSKQIWPRTYIKNEKGEYKWAWKHFDAPRPLYGLEKIKQTDKKVLLCEGEKATDAAQELFGDKIITMSWSGGSNSIKKADWSTLKDRDIIIWPDADQAGMKAAEGIYELIKDIVNSVKIAKPPKDLPKGFDAADALQEGWTINKAREFIKTGLKDYEDLLEKRKQQEDKNKAERQRYEQVKQEYGDDLPFKILGYNQGSYYYLSNSGGQVIELTAGGHTPLNLMQLAELSFWEVTFPKRSSAGVDWQGAADHIMSKSIKKGIYSAQDCRRGLGAWNDNNRSVLHLGDKLIVDGVATSLTDFKSDYTYERSLSLKLQNTTPLSDDRAAMLLAICDHLKWENQLSGKLLAGWIVSAMVCGALSWRPHIWLTGSAGSGKTTVMRDVIGRVLKNIALEVEGKTTEAGIRSKLGFDALPITFDEAESEDETDAKRMKAVLDLARVASSESGGLVYKGSSNGKAVSYRIRSCFCFSSINTSFSHYADATRITPLILGTIKNDSEQNRKLNQKHYKELMHMIFTHLTPEYNNGLFVRAAMNIPVLLHNIEVYSAAASIALGNRRYGDQIAPMLAGAKLLMTTNQIDLNEAEKEIKQYDWSNHTAIQTQTDEELLLQTIYEKFIRCEDHTERTVKELIDLVFDDL